MKDTGQLVARVLLAQIFVIAGFNKIVGYSGTAGYMEAMGVPAIFLVPVIILELGGGIVLAVGWQTRWAALALAVFTALAALIFHSDLGDRGQSIMFMKNWAIVGGLLLLAIHGPGPMSLGRRRAGIARTDQP